MLTVKEYQEKRQTGEDENIRKVLMCSDCGQLYFYEFVELRDMVDGDDPQYRKLIPVESTEDGDKIYELEFSEFYLIKPRLSISWPKMGPMTFAWTLPENYISNQRNHINEND